MGLRVILILYQSTFSFLSDVNGWIDRAVYMNRWIDLAAYMKGWIDRDTHMNGSMAPRLISTLCLRYCLSLYPS